MIFASLTFFCLTSDLLKSIDGPTLKTRGSLPAVTCNSQKELKWDTRPMGSISVSVVYEQNGQRENKATSRSFRMGAEMLTPALATELAAEVTSGIDERFAARRPKGGQMPVVMGAGASGILLHEAMGHAFEADFNRKGTSIFADKMGCQICPKGIQIR